EYSSVCDIGVRRSFTPVISIVGVVTLPTYISGERRRCSLGSSQGSFSKLRYQDAPSVVPTKLSQFVTGQFAEAAANRSVWPTVHDVSTPPPLQPYTYMRFSSTMPFAITASTPAIRSSKSLLGYAFLIALPNCAP